MSVEVEKMADDKEKLHKLQINISKGALKKIDEMKKLIESSSRTEVIKSSLKYYNFILQEKAKDKNLKVLLKDSEGNTKELVI
jgi:metal-responsive CopG/Arc/MetJ family transcriptional regulator